jgi:hypothetical protein
MAILTTRRYLVALALFGAYNQGKMQGKMMIRAIEQLGNGN